MRRLLLLLGPGLAFCLCANAAVVSVCNESNLRAAMSQGGVVSFGCSGTIILTQPITVSTNVALTGVGAQVTIGANTSRLFNVSPGVEFELASLQITGGSASYGGAISNDGGRIVLDGVLIDWNNARSTGEGSIGVGGAIYSRGGILIASNCVFSSNGAYSRNDSSRVNIARGGAICVEGGTLQIVNCLFQDNKAQGGNGGGPYPQGVFGLGAGASGAAIYSSGTGTVQRCRFLHNVASGGNGAAGWIGFKGGFSGGSVGGAVMYNAGTLHLSECTFMNNVASGGSAGDGWDGSGPDTPGGGGAGGSIGGAVISNQGWLSLVNCTFANNAGSGGNGGSGGDNNADHAVPGEDGGLGGSAAGGAIFNSVNSAAAFLTNCTVVSNALVGGAGGSGGRGGTCPICGPPPRPGTTGGGGANGGTASGAGLYMAGGTSVVVHCTFGGNSVRGGTNGIGGPGGGDGSRTAPAGGDGIPGESLGGALCVDGGNVQAANSIFSRSVGSMNCFGYLLDLGVNVCSDQSSCFMNPASLKNVDAGLQPLADNGGLTMTAALLPSSLAYNRGSNSFASATDQRGVPRPQGKFCDVGAYEIGHLWIEKSGDTALIRYGAPQGSFYRLQGRPNWSAWRDLGGDNARADGYVRYGPIPMTNQLEVFRTVKP